MDRDFCDFLRNINRSCKWSTMVFNLDTIFIRRCTIKLRHNCGACRITGPFVTCYTVPSHSIVSHPTTDLSFTRWETLFLQNRKLRISTSSVTCSNNSNALLTTACTTQCSSLRTEKNCTFGFSRFR